MKQVITLFAMLLSTAASAQSTYTASRDAGNGSTIFKGAITMSDLYGEPTFTWLRRGEKAYTPDSNAVAFLRKELSAYSIVTVMGTWCEDSHNLVPKLSKTLTAARFPAKQHIIFGVDRAKETGGIEAQVYNIKLVPTIIVYKGQLEIGRIVESAKRNIETDLVQIIQQELK